ncbi:TPA: hypothetical protein ACPZA1_004230, partial [Yersinia enterocolitica]
MIEENKPLPAQYLNVVSVSNSTNISEKPELSSEKPIITPLFEDKKNTIEKARDEINKLCDTQECDLDELKNARVKLARKQFFINVIESIVSLSSFVVSVG